jgi:ABC-type cobalamin/Fe3+-siderophores transport system ATPase subunit
MTSIGPACVGERWVVLRRGAIYADGPPASVLTRTMLADVFDVDLEPNNAPAPYLP